MTFNELAVLFPIGKTIKFKYCGAISNNEIVSGIIIGYDGGDRVRVNYNYNGIEYYDSSVYFSRILP